MRFFVESWSPDYGSPGEGLADDTQVTGRVDASIEVPAEQWQPITPEVRPAESVIFVDGVQQIDARVWTNDDGVSRMGICASIAAGSVRCDGVAKVDSVEVRRHAFGAVGLGEIDCGRGVVYSGVPVADTSPEGLDTHLRSHREDLEVAVAKAAGQADLVIVDGHVRQRESIVGAVGYLKSHQAQYLEREQNAVVGRLVPGQRTPFFLLETPWSRYSWYVKLPGSNGHPWAGVVRCEASPSLQPREVSRLADQVTATLPSFASETHKDPRAPQNLYPIGGLERELRRRLGERGLLLRALQRASFTS